MRLTEYITETHGKEERVGDICITNCENTDNTLWAALEVGAVQKMNTTAISDKTYHLILSFRPGEDPSSELLKKVESEVCGALGFEGHQRISAVHHDTDNVHLHVAINKIHPETYNIRTPYRDHHTLAKICKELEAKYNIEVDNHDRKQSLSEAKAADMAKMSGLEDLIGWVRREALPEAEKADTWDKFHVVLAKNGLSLGKRGNGFVVTDNKSGQPIKASSISRSMSKQALEKRLGEYAPASPLGGVVQERAYNKVPVASYKPYSPLFTEYQETRESREKMLQERLSELKAAMDAEIRNAVGVGITGKLTRRVFVGKTKTNKKARDITTRYARLRHEAYNRFGRKGWLDWLREEAKGKRSDALFALRVRNKGLRGGLTVGGVQKLNDVFAKFKIDSVTRSGIVIYRRGTDTIRDDGDRFKLDATASEATIKAAIEAAILRHGKTLSIEGTNDFKDRVLSVIASNNINMFFKDKELDARREHLLSLNLPKQHIEERARGTSEIVHGKGSENGRSR